MGPPYLQIQFHGVYPHALPTIERVKVADFCAASDNTMPPLPWSSIAPPFTSATVIPPKISGVQEWNFFGNISEEIFDEDSTI
jgi:hypothetical protein